MKTALRTIAFSTATDTEAAAALMEIALEALDRGGHSISAALLDLALVRLHQQQAKAPVARRLDS